MSASKERQERAGLRESGSYKKLNEKAEEERKEKRRKTRNWIILAVVVVLAIVVVLFGTNVLYGSAAAVRIGSESYTAADYNFYYSSLQQNYRSYYESLYGSSDYADMFMPSGDAMKQSTLDIMQNIAMRASEAKKAGFTVSEDAKLTIDRQVSTLQSAAASNGLTTDDFIAASYGRGVNEKVLRRDMENWLLADEYTQYLKDSYNYSDEEIDAYYAENKNEIDTVSYNTYYVGTTVGGEGTEAVTIDDAAKTAETFVQRLAQGEAFYEIAASLSSEEEKVFYADESSTRTSSSYPTTSALYADWLFDEARRDGESSTFLYEDEEGTATGYYVVQFLSRDTGDYTLRNVRHILARTAEVDSAEYGDDAEGYQEAVEIAKSEAEARAQDIYDEWLSGDATEDSFAALATERSDDSGTASDGGLLENIYKGMTVPGFEDWCFDTRKPGDTGIVESDYGYHIMYFVSEGEPYYRYTARNLYVDETYNAWETASLENYPVNTTGMFSIETLLDVVKK